MHVVPGPRGPQGQRGDQGVTGLCCRELSYAVKWTQVTQSLHVLRVIANMIETIDQYQVLLTNSKLYTTFTEVLPHVSTLSDEHQA